MSVWVGGWVGVCVCEKRDIKHCSDELTASFS